MRHAVKDLLMHNGFGCILEANDPIRAVGQIRQLTPSTIILDTTWREVNGLWFARLLRELAPQSKIILLLDDSRPEYEDAARSSGADAYIPKNALTNELARILNQWKPCECPDKDATDR